jgi:hypothetical protein
MLRLSLRGLAVAALAAVALGSPAPAAALTQINGCGDLTKAGEVYVLTTDIVSSSVCFRILADRITLDLGGHTVTGPDPFSEMGVFDGNVGRINTVVKNGTITNFGWGMLLTFSTRSTVRNVTLSGNAEGMEIGPDSLVKDCTVHGNVRTGIEAGDRVQVEGCLIEQNNTNRDSVSGGLIGGQRTLATRNIVRDNGIVGIRVGSSSTVTHNTLQFNAGDGISVGPKSLVSSNTSNNNDADGIEAVCPSTVTHNTALDNDGENYNPIGTGCVDQHNIFSERQ